MKFVNEAVSSGKIFCAVLYYGKKYYGIGTIVHFVNGQYPDSIFDGKFFLEENNYQRKKPGGYLIFDDVNDRKNSVAIYQEDFESMQIEIIHAEKSGTYTSTRLVKNANTNLRIIAVPILFFSLILKEFYLVWIIVISFLIIFKKYYK